MAKMNKQEFLQRRRNRIRKKISGTPEQVRLSIRRSSKHIYAQIIDDTKGLTLCCASSLSKEIRDEMPNGQNQVAAKTVGKLIAEKAKAAGVVKVVFDRAGRLYHGRVKALAEGARDGGLQF